MFRKHICVYILAHTILSFKKYKAFWQFFFLLSIWNLASWVGYCSHLGVLCLELDCLLASPKQEEVLPPLGSVCFLFHCSLCSKGGCTVGYPPLSCCPSLYKCFVVPFEHITSINFCFPLDAKCVVFLLTLLDLLISNSLICISMDFRLNFLFSSF